LQKSEHQFQNKWRRNQQKYNKLGELQLTNELHKSIVTWEQWQQ
jgi:hypothetical protein